MLVVLSDVRVDAQAAAAAATAAAAGMAMVVSSGTMTTLLKHC